MSLTKTPTSSLSVVQSFVMRVLYRGLARIKKCSGRAPIKVPATRSPPITKLPQDIFQMIIAHLIYDKRHLLACSLTCCSWYIAVVPHLHHTLTTVTMPWWERKAPWPQPLLHMHRLGLLPLVKKFLIYGGPIDPNGFSPSRLNLLLLPRFAMLTNVQELEIEYLDIPGFIPRVRQYFGHFLPTVRSLTLREPKGCHRQIFYFVGLFRHLEDLRLLFRNDSHFPEGQVNNLGLTPPPFTPPLRGRLEMTFIGGAVLLKDMIKLFGGIRFRYMDLYNVDRMLLLLDACTETLEALRLHLTDPHVGSLFRDSGSSRNKSLRTLEVTADSLNDALAGGSLDPASCFMKHLFSTTTSSAFPEVIVIHRDHNFCDVIVGCYVPINLPLYRWENWRAEEASWHHRRFEVFHEVRKVRDFRLVLCADVWDRVAEDSVRALKAAVAAEKARGMLDDYSSEPVVICNPRATPADLGETTGRRPYIPWYSPFAQK